MLRNLRWRQCLLGLVLLAAAAPASASTVRVGAPCGLTTHVPVLIDGKVVGSGTVRCRTAHRADVEVTVELFNGGQWQSFADFFDGNVRLPASRTKTFRTFPAKCTGLGNLPMRTELRVSLPHRKLTKIGPSTELPGCGIHHPG